MFPLFIASKLGYLSSVTLLLDNKANILQYNSEGETSVFIAAEKGHLEVSRLLLDRGADQSKPRNNSSSPLIMASANGFLEITKLLLAKGASPNQVLRGDGASPLYFAVQENKPDIVKALLDDPKTDVNLSRHNGMTALFVAAEQAYLDIVKLLLAKGKNLEIDKANENGITPYLVAQQKLLYLDSPDAELTERYKEILRLLEEKGADTHKRTSFILESMHRLGYKIAEKGMCYGIAHMAVQATMRGELEKTLARMERLSSQGFEDVFERILEKRKRSAPLSASSSGLGGREDPLNEEEKEELNLLSFFDGISMYAGNYDLGFVQDWERTHEIFNKDIEWQSQKVFIRKDTEKIKNLISWAAEQEEAFINYFHLSSSYYFPQ